MLLSTSTAAAGIVDEIRDAIASRTALRLTGAGTWVNAGWPVRAKRRLSLAPHSGIVEYVPGDLTLTALAGTTMGELTAVTGANGQWLPLDPFGSPASTIGAVIATGSFGPLAHAHGAPRDQVLGVEAVLGNGEIVRGGGRVTKNVAGFDLTRLLIGSWGTLGAITEVTVRLRAQPQDEMTVALEVPSEPGRLAERLRAMREAPVEAMAMELVDGALAASLDLGDASLLIVRLGGNPQRLAAQRATLAAVGDVADIDPRVWTTLREIEPAGAWVWRMSDLSSRIGETWTHAQRIARAAERCWLHATVSRGIVRCIAIPSSMNADPLSAALADRLFPGTIVFEQLPDERWPILGRPATGDTVSRRIRRAFDPHWMLNPGILGEGPP
jgi:glycolate oxidase FAD binding subunit